MEILWIFIGLNAFVLICAYVSLFYQFARKIKCNCNVSLSGKTVLITGGSNGIGKETAKTLARLGARVLIASSNTYKCLAAVQEIRECSGNQNVDFYQVDLSDCTSVRQLAQTIKSQETNLHLLINNAGIGYHEKAKTRDGCDTIFATNYLGHFLLTYLLVGLLKSSAPSRVVNVTSICQRLSVNGLDFTKHVDKFGSEVYPHLSGYSSSKIAMLLHTKELSRRLAGHGITVNAVHPGLVVDSDIWYKAELILPRPIAVLMRLLVRSISVSSEVAAQNVIHAAISKDLEGISGRYYERCAPARENTQAANENAARQLWNLSMLFTGCTQNGHVIQELPYANETNHGAISAYDYLVQGKQKPLTSPDFVNIDRRCEVPLESKLAFKQ